MRLYLNFYDVVGEDDCLLQHEAFQISLNG